LRGVWWGRSSSAPPGAFFNAPHIRLSLGWLLPSRASLRFTGHLLHPLCFRLKIEALLSPPKSVLPRQIPSSLSEIDSILFHRLKQSRIKHFFCFHNGPRNDQQLCRKFYSHLDFDTALLFSSLQRIGKILNEVIVS
jgi:hypothetical protein